MKKLLVALAVAAFAVTSQAQVTVAKPAEKAASAPEKKEVKRSAKPAEKASAPAKK